MMTISSEKREKEDSEEEEEKKSNLSSRKKKNKDPRLRAAKNDKCPCGSLKRYRLCCMKTDMMPKSSESSTSNRVTVDGALVSIAI